MPDPRTVFQFHSEYYNLLGGINVKVSQYDQPQQEFRDLTNVNFQVPKALTKRYGSTAYTGSSVIGSINSLYEFNRLNGASWIIASANTNLYTLTQGGIFQGFNSGLLNRGVFDFVTFVDRLFAGNGKDFFKWDGTNVLPFSLPPGISVAFSMSGLVGGSLTAGVTATFIASYGYINDRGYFGPESVGVTLTIDGVTTNSIQYVGMTVPSGYGITAMALYRTSPGGVDPFFTTYCISTTTSAVDTGFPLTDLLANDNLFFTMAPKYMELYNNQLFLAGFSAALSTVYWSDIGEPEGVAPDSFAEFRTNDGDRITGMKTYNGSLIVTKQKSFHRLSGEVVDNFSLQEISDQYGCLSNRTLVQWENYLAFLSEKGIVMYNGANIDIMSAKIQPIFETMNIPAAIDNAVGMFNRLKNELWFAIPVNGSTTNNVVIVYDTVVSQWTKYEGLNPCSMQYMNGPFSHFTAFYGGYTGNVFNFMDGLTGDNGNAITCVIKSHFLAARQQTNQNMYRRFYLDVNPILGFTQPITVSFTQDYGSSIILTNTMYQAPFQSRIDMGISSRSIQANIYHVSASTALQLNGFTFTSRFLRDR